MNMNNKILLAVLAGSLWMYPMAAFSLEQEEAVSAPEQVVETLAGSIASIDLEGKTIVVQSAAAGDENAPETTIFNIAESLKVLKDGQEVASSEIKAGDTVSVDYSVDQDGNKVISTLNVVSQEALSAEDQGAAEAVAAEVTEAVDEATETASATATE